MDKKYRIFYKPEDGWFADCIPFYHNGMFYLYYLHDYRNIAECGEGVPWRLVTTKDFVEFEEHGEMICRGSQEDQDLYIFTGCVFKKQENDFYLFYTGHNPHFTDTPQEKVMLARSSDLLNWTKVDDFMLSAPSDKYYGHDWRDPFVYFDENKQKYCMLLAARIKEQSTRKAGATALCTSTDLINWTVEEDFWAPDAYFTHECPDHFTMGGNKYLIFSEFTDKCCTQYRKIEDGHFIQKNDGIFDGRAYYAAKSVANENGRYLFGWIPTKENDSDDNKWQWGGNLAVHELYVAKDGSLRTKMPASIKEKFTKVIYHQDEIVLDGYNKYNLLDLETNNEHVLISVDVVFDEYTTLAGVGLRHNNETDDVYQYELLPYNNMFKFDVCPNHPWAHANFINSTRVCNLKAGETYHLDIIVDNDLCVAYLNNEIALSSRMYINSGYPLSLFTKDGKTTFKNLTIKAL